MYGRRMTIDDSGEWWRGTEFVDLLEYLDALEPEGYPIQKVVEARCTCGDGVFHVHLQPDDELAQTECVACGALTFVADSEQHWDVADDIEDVACPCGGTTFEVGLGLAIRGDAGEEWVRWASLGHRCVSCGVLGSALNWKSDLSLSDDASTRVSPQTPPKVWDVAAALDD